MEIESALVANPMVAEAAVVGKPDDTTGESICAFVVLKRSRPQDEEAKQIAQELRNWVAKRKSAHHRQAQGNPLWRQPAEDPLRQDHAAPAPHPGA